MLGVYVLIGGNRAIDAVIRNTFTQGTLSIVFAVLVLIVAAAGTYVCVKAIRAGRLPTTESPEAPSKIFAPAGFIPNAAEKELQKEWDELIDSARCGRRAPRTPMLPTPTATMGRMGTAINRVSNGVVAAMRAVHWWTGR